MFENLSSLINLINSPCAAIRSDKVTARNKAADQIENHLTSSKNELFDQLENRCNSEVSWTTILNSAIDATIKHAIKVDEARDSKNYQTMRNKNYVFSAIVNKLINYNFEGTGNEWKWMVNIFYLCIIIIQNVFIRIRTSFLQNYFVCCISRGF